MKLKTLLLSIGVVIIGFWLLGLAFKIAGWILNALLFVGVVFVVFSLIKQYFEDRKKAKVAKK